MSIFTDRYWMLIAVAIPAISPGRAWTAPAGATKPPSSVLSALACVLNIHRDALRALPLATQTVAFRYSTGDIPGTSPEGRLSAVNCLIYAAGKPNAVLMIAMPRDGGWQVLPDYYVLDHSDQAWTVIEGNGGQSTYAAIGTFATAHEQSPLYKANRKQLSIPKPCETP
jgi:hypothetical protein